MQPRDAFAAFYDDNIRDVYSYARARVGADEAEDVTAEVFHAAALAFRQGRSDQLSTAWLIAVARNKIIDRWRKAERRKARSHLLPDRDRAVQFPPDWHEDERREAVQAAIDVLSDRHRSLLILHHLDGLSIRSIADDLDLTESAVESRLARARRAFRKAYEGGRP